MKTAAVFNLDELPAQAQQKAAINLSISDLTPAQQVQANQADLAVVKNGSRLTILAPTGNLSEALTATKNALNGR